MSPRRLLVPIALVFVVVLVGAGIAAATRKPPPAPQANTSRAPIYELARVSAVDADKFDAHAAAMERIATAQPAHAQWAADAEQVRNDASALRFIARSALAIAADGGSSPDTSVEVRRVLGDGLNLDQLGVAAVQQAEKMQTHVDAMRAAAAGDRQLLSLIDGSAPDVEMMRRDGQAAVERGKALETVARGIAQSTGQPLPGR